MLQQKVEFVGRGERLVKFDDGRVVQVGEHAFLDKDLFHAVISYELLLINLFQSIQLFHVFNYSPFHFIIDKLHLVDIAISTDSYLFLAAEVAQGEFSLLG